jgi:hypothetical protein
MPQLVEIDIDDILVEESLFNLKEIIFSEDTLTNTLRSSFRTLGILEPVLVYKDRDTKVHLIDGRKRIEFLRDTGHKKIRALLLSKVTSIRELYLYILYQRRSQILESTINTVQFIKKVAEVCKDTEWITRNICIPLGIKPHRRLFEEIDVITGVPHEVRSFFHEKRFSYKQILNFSYYPHDLLTTVLSWRKDIYLTASLFEEIVTLLRDILETNKLSIKEFLSDLEVKDIFDSEMPPKKKTEALRRLLFKRRHPVLTGTNEEIERAVDEMSLPENISVSWDRTLENKELIIKMKILSPEHLIYSMNILNKEKILEGVKKILDKL